MDKKPVTNDIGEASEFLLRPLLSFKKNYDLGKDLFNYLFYNRSEEQGMIQQDVQKCKNITIVGSPGEGKTSLVHRMMNEFENSPNVYTIILDFSESTPLADIPNILVDFVNNMIDYFISIKRPCLKITAPVSTANCVDYFKIVSRHLESLTLSELTKKLVIFLDDLDHAEEQIYNELLRKYFLTYARSDKSIMILSCRRPLYNSIKKDDLFSREYCINAHEVVLRHVTLHSILNNRLKALLKESENENPILKMIKALKKPDLDSYLLKIAKDQGVNIDNGYGFEELPFTDSFYVELSDITNSNLRDVERLMPQIIKYQLKNRDADNFNTNFLESYFTVVGKNETYLSDLVSTKTDKGVSIHQVILEYFYFYEVKDDNFYSIMKNEYGIKDVDVNTSLAKLIDGTSALIEPEAILSINKTTTLREKFVITRKGIKYVEDILRNDKYYKLYGASRSIKSFYEDNREKKW